MRPRRTASSTTSWRRSRESVTLCSRASRKASTLLSARPALALDERLRALEERLLVPVRFDVVRFALERDVRLRDPDLEREPPDPVAIRLLPSKFSLRRPGLGALSVRTISLSGDRRFGQSSG